MVDSHRKCFEHIAHSKPRARISKQCDEVKISKQFWDLHRDVISQLTNERPESSESLCSAWVWGKCKQTMS
jgi:hypothetical protein